MRHGTRVVVPPLKVCFAALLAVAISTTAVPAPAGKAAVVPSPPEAKEIAGRIKAAEADEALDDALKQQITEQYRQALAFQQQAAAWAAKAAALEKAATEAPAQVARLKAQLDEAPPEASLELPAGLTPVQIEQRLAKVRLDRDKRKTALERLESEIKSRPAKRQQLPQDIARARAALEQTNRRLAAKPPAEEPPALTEARRVRLLWQRAALVQEIAAREKELVHYDAAGPLLTLQRDIAARALSVADRHVKTLEEHLRRRQEMARGRATARAWAALRAAAGDHEMVRALAAENAALAQEASSPDGPASRRDRIVRRLENVKALLTRLDEDFRRMRERVQKVGDQPAVVGLWLRMMRRAIPSVREHQQALRARREENAKVQLRIMALREQRDALADPTHRIEAIRETLRGEADMADEVRAEIEAKAAALLRAQRDNLDLLLKDYEAYLAALFDLDEAERRLVVTAEAVGKYIDERVLWVRSTSPLRARDARSAWEALCWFGPAAGWRGLASAAARDVAANWSLYGLAAVGVSLLLLFRRRMRRGLRAMSDRLRSASTDRFHYTLTTLLFAVLRAAPWPAILAFFAWRLSAAGPGASFAEALGTGLHAAAFALFLVDLLRAMCLEGGLLPAHFRWHEGAVQVLRRSLFWFRGVVVPLVFLHATVEGAGVQEWSDTLGRLLLMAVLLVVSFLMQRILRPSGALVADLAGRAPAGWVARFRYPVYGLAVGIPALLAVLAGLGYYYTAQQLTQRLEGTFVLVLGLALANALLRRLVHVFRRRLALGRARERQAERRAQATRPAERDAFSASLKVSSEEMNIYTMNLQTRRLFSTLTLAALLLGLWFIWSDVLPALRALDRVVLWRTAVAGAPATPPTAPEAPAPGTGPAREGAESPALAGSSSRKMMAVTLADLLLAVLIAAVTVAATRNLPGLLEIFLLRRLPLDQGLRFAITTLARYAIIILGVVFAFRAIGIGWAKVQWLAAAVTFGLAFGLQEIVANFVSGLIILFERPMRPGDVVTVGDITGIVTRIRIRATTITDLNRKELIVPNREFITSRLVNWTLSDQVLRVVVPVGIAYGSDTQFARRVMLKVAESNASVLKDPPPEVLFLGFGESALNFELRAYVGSFARYYRTLHELHMAVDDAFRKAGIEIAFPQMDVHVRSTPSDAPVAPPITPRAEPRKRQ